MSATDAARQFELGLSLHRQGQAGLAESHYLRVVKLDPLHADAWHLLGVIAFQAGNLPKAIKQFRQAVAVRPGFAQAWNNLALALKERGDPAAAREAFARALAVRPEYVEAAYNLGILHQQAGDAAAAEQAWRQALQWQPAHAPTLTNLGNLLRGQRRAGEAVGMLSRAHELAPSADSACNLALALLDAGRLAAARSLAEACASQMPASADAWEILGAVARLQNDMDGALPALERAVALDAARGGGWFELALVRKAVGDDAGAMAAFGRARQRLGDLPRLRWAQALAVPALSRSEAAVDAAVARFGEGLEVLARFDAPAGSSAALDELDAAATVVPFHLHYLPRDTTQLQCRFGDLVAATTARAVPELATPGDWAPRPRGARLRVGFVSPHWQRHTVSRYFSGLVSGLDPKRFERFVWHCGERADDASAALAAGVEHFAHRQAPLPVLAAEIRAARLDVLVHADIGMDSRQHVLAAWRLAPRQAMLYGHPVTSGLPTIDAYFSAEAYEPDAAQACYRERLVLLPALGAAPQRWDDPPQGEWFRAVRGDRPALLCLQNLSKATPAFDAAVVRILAACDARLFLFDRGSALTRSYLEGLAACANARGVDLHGRIGVLGARPYAEFLGAVAGADLVLDTDWFSGGSTSLDAIAAGVPLVAWRGPQARGRQTAGMLAMLGAPELVFESADGYVEGALALLADPARRARLGALLRERAPLLFDGSAAIRGFGDALEALALRD
jgi:predicted O-linked N-acetylglucosamine transferase (SPINDLY family)